MVVSRAKFFLDDLLNWTCPRFLPRFLAPLPLRLSLKLIRQVQGLLDGGFVDQRENILAFRGQEKRTCFRPSPTN